MPAGILNSNKVKHKWRMEAEMLYPQMNKYRSVADVSGSWQFMLDPEEKGEKGRWFVGLPSSRPIGVPGSWNEQFQDTMFYMGTAWYQTDFHVPPGWRGKRVKLRFGAAGYHTTVFLDGEPLGTHEGNSLPFEYDITQHVEPGQDATVTICVDSKQRWDVDALTGACDIIDAMFIPWGGIWGHVALEARGETWLEHLFVFCRLVKPVAI